MSRGASASKAATTLELPCLGLPFQLGMLYDCRNDKLVPGITLWDEKLLSAALCEKPQPSSTFSVTAEDSISKKMFNLGVKANLSLSVLSGLVKVSGSAEYLDDRQSSSKEARVTLKYSCTSKFAQLTMEQLATCNIQHPEVFDKGTATHVVTAVQYGAEAFFIFDRKMESGEDFRKVHGDMEVLVKAIPGITEIKGSADLALKDQDKKEVDKFQCKFYGDLILQSNPSTFNDAVKVYKELPTYFGKEGEKTVPKKVWLYPLSSLDSKAARMVREISINLVTQAQQAIESLNHIEIRSNDLLNTEVYDRFTSLNQQVSQFAKMISEHRTDLMKQLAAILPSIRGGGANEKELATLLETRVHKSPFNTSSLNAWLKGKEEEVKVLTQYLTIMKNSKGITMAFAPGDIDSAINDVDYDHVLSFEFKVVRKSDSASFLHNMFSFLRNGEISSSLEDNSSHKPWFKVGAIIKDLRLKTKQFTTFANANVGSKDVKFVLTDSSEDIDQPVTDNKGALILHYEYGASSGEFEPPSQPSKPIAKGKEHNNIQLEWKAPQQGSACVECYNVSYRCIQEPSDKWTMQKTRGQETAIVINSLNPDTSYVFKVCAECPLGISQTSEQSDVIETKSAPVNLHLQNVISHSTPLSTGPPVIYKIKVRPMRLKQKLKNIAKMEFGVPPHPAKPTKVLMVVGATGAGKSTLINGMINYIFKVKWENEFRFKLIHDEVSQGQAHSQTQMITAYTFYWHEGSPLGCNLTIIDTPGFGDTRGLERDQEITKQIREFFQMKGRDGVDELHAIGFVTQASLARLTPTQKYISDSILSVFGKDIKDSIFIMTTFADGADPPVMEAVREAKIPHAAFFPFNNSALFANPSGAKSRHAKLFWEMGTCSFDDFFAKFIPMKGVSLQLTRQVLEERHQLETIVVGIQPKIDAGLAKIDELHQEEQVLKDRESDILANEDFTYSITVTKQRQINAPRGTYVTNCATCHYTCHKDCAFDDDRDKWKCSAMNGAGQSDAICTVCPGSCSWRKHFNNGYHFELYQEVETRTKQELLDRYNEAKSAKANVEGIIVKMESELEQLQKTVLYNIRRARTCLQRLDQIALKPNPLTEVEYIDLLIKSEEQQKKPGWKKRVDYFYQVRKHAEVLAKVKDQKEFEEMAKQNSKTLWQRFSTWGSGLFSSSGQS